MPPPSMECRWGANSASAASSASAGGASAGGVNGGGEGEGQDALLYAWRLGVESGTNAVAIGQSVPLDLTFVPLEKVLVHAIVVGLERESFRGRFVMSGSI